MLVYIIFTKKYIFSKFKKSTILNFPYLIFKDMIWEKEFADIIFFLQQLLNFLRHDLAKGVCGYYFFVQQYLIFRDMI